MYSLWARSAANADPIGALSVVPRRISAEFSSNDLLHIEVDVFDLTEEQLSLAAGKIGEAVSIYHAHWDRPGRGEIGAIYEPPARAVLLRFFSRSS